MKKFTTFCISIILCSTFCFAQTYDTTQYFGKMNYVFQNVNKSQITSGILRDYGMEFLNLDNYTGAVMHDSNFVGLHEWRMLYTGLYSSQISSSNMLYLDTVNRLINKYDQTSQPVTFVGMYYKYQQLRDDAITANLMTTSNDRLYDVAGRTQSPYLNKELFAIAPVRQAVYTGNSSLMFRPELFLGNSGKTISAIAVDPNGGSSYQNVALNTPFTVTYNSVGFYNINIKVTYTDATVKYTHTKLAVHQSAAQARFGTGSTPATNEPVSATKSYLGTLGLGDITIDLAANNTTGQIRKPLIIVEGFDPDGSFAFNGKGGLLDRMNNDLNTNNSITLNSDLDDINQYDLIFLNYGNGTDYIQRNAYLLERVIQIVNSRKTTWNGVRQQNVIIGMSMGGLVTRYALRDMEQTGVAHETRLFISHDAPQWGANVPVGAQAAVQHLAPWKIIDFTWQRTIYWRDMFPQVVDALALFNSPAAKQMVIQRYTLSGQTLTPDNTAHNAFLNEINQMGWPVNCKNVALSNGACNGTKTFPDNSTIFTIDGARPTTYFGSLWQSLVSTILSVSSLPTIAAPTVPLNHWAMLWQFPLSLFSTKSSIGLDFKIRAVPSSGTQEIYRGDVYSKRKILFAINVTNYFIKCHVSSTTDMLPLDNAPGGKYDINQFGIQASTIQQQLPSFFQGYITATTLQPQFCFVPTVSSLDFVSPQQFLSSNFCNTAICNMRSGIKDYYSPPLSELHISYTQANTNWIIQRQDPNSTCVAICPSSLSITGNEPVCTTSSFSVNKPSGASVTWSVSPTTVATVNSSTGVVTRVSNGSATLTATVTSCGISVPVQKTIQVGNTPSSFSVSGPSSSCNNQTVYFSTNAPVGNINWFWPSDWTYQYGQNSTTLTLITGNTSGSVGVSVPNACGSPTTASKYVQINNCGGFAIEASPNPTTDNVTIAVAEQKGVAKANKKKAMMYKLKVTDQLGNVKKQYKYSSGTSNTSISLRELINGLYTIQAFDGTVWSSTKVIKQ